MVGIIAVDRQVLLLIRGNWLSRVLRPNSLRRSHIFSDLSGCAQQIMMNSDRRLVQFKVGIICMLFIKAVSILRRHEVGICAYLFSPLINSPVVKNIGLGGCCRSGSSGATRINFDCLTGRGNRAHAGAVGSHRIVDGHFSLFPDSKQIFIRLFLVSCDLRCQIA